MVNGPLRTLKLLWDLMWLRRRRSGQLVREDERSFWQVFLMWLVIGVGMVMLFSFSCTLFRLVDPASDVGLPPEIAFSAEQGLASFFAIGGFWGLMTGLAQTNDVLYARADLAWAMCLPLDRRGIMYARIAETAMAVIMPVAGFTLPAILAYALVLGAWPALLLAPLFVLGVTLLFSALSVVFSAMAGRWATTARAREIMGLLGSLVGAVLYVKMMTTSQQAGPRGMEVMAKALARFLSSPAAATAALVAAPATWPALALHYLSGGRVFACILTVTVGLGMSAGVAWLVAASVAGTYYRSLGRSGVRAGRAKRRAGDATGRSGQFRSTRILPALMGRDWAILTRSPRLWQPMMMQLAWVAYMVYTLSRLPFGTLDPLMSGALGGAVAALLAQVLASMSMGVEGGSFYHLATLPLKPIDRVKSKVVVFGLPPVVLGLSAAVALQRGVPGILWLLWALALALTGATVATSITISNVAANTNFEAVNTKEWHKTPASGFLAMLAVGLLCLIAYIIIKIALSLGEWMQVAPSFARTVAVVLIMAIYMGAIVPPVMRRAAAIVRARELSARVPD